MLGRNSYFSFITTSRYCLCLSPFCLILSISFLLETSNNSKWKIMTAIAIRLFTTLWPHFPLPPPQTHTHTPTSLYFILSLVKTNVLSVIFDTKDVWVEWGWGRSFSSELSKCKIIRRREWSGWRVMRGGARVVKINYTRKKNKDCEGKALTSSSARVYQDDRQLGAK